MRKREIANKSRKRNRDTSYNVSRRIISRLGRIVVKMLLGTASLTCIFRCQSLLFRYSYSESLSTHAIYYLLKILQKVVTVCCATDTLVYYSSAHAHCLRISPSLFTFASQGHNKCRNAFSHVSYPSFTSKHASRKTSF